MWAAATFCGVDLLTYTIMSNHFHLLVRVPVKGEISDEELALRARNYFGAKNGYTTAIEDDLKTTGKISTELRCRLTRRMSDVSMFLKELKQRYTRWFNRTHDRYGTLWAERFKSVLVENEPLALRTVAAYIDLNCVRAGLVSDPKDYRFCGYAEAIATAADARTNLASFLEGKKWHDQAALYRTYLFCNAAASGHSNKKILSREAILSELKNHGRLDNAVLLRVKVRYFTDGAVLGSQEFVNHVFTRFRNYFSKKRSSGARPMGGGDWRGLNVLRALRLNVFG